MSTYLISWDLDDAEISTAEELDEIIDQQLSMVSPNGDPFMFEIGPADRPGLPDLEFAISEDRAFVYHRPSYRYAVEKTVHDAYWNAQNRDRSWFTVYHSPHRRVTVSTDCTLISPQSAREVVREYIRTGQRPIQGIPGLAWD